MDAYIENPSPWRASRYPGYLAAATAGRIAESMWVGVVMLVLARTHDASLAGAIVAAATLPSLVSAPLIGAWLDVTARRRAALAANEVALIACVGALLLLVGHAPVPVVLLFAVAAGIGQPLVGGGFSSLMPGLVPPAALPRANALESMSYGVADVAGPALAGVLAAALGPPAALAGQAALAALCLALLAALPATVPPAEDRPADVRRALAAGARLLVRTPALRGVTTTSLLGAACFGLLTVALPTLAARLTGDTAAAGGLYAAIAGGAIAGAAVLPRLEGRVPAAALVQGASAAQGLVFVVIGLVGTTTPVALALCVVCGLPQGLALAALFAVRIECTPPALRSQVFTSVAGMKAGFGAAGAAASGVLVAAYGPGATIALVGLGLVAATGLGVACSHHADLRLPLPGVRRALRGARP